VKWLVIYERGEDGGWGAYLPDLPGCISTGATRAEVERNIADAVPFHLEGLREAGAPVPEPHSYAGSVTA
jgi:predicted RNase H-like HicB family nuclease